MNVFVPKSITHKLNHLQTHGHTKSINYKLTHSQDQLPHTLTHLKNHLQTHSLTNLLIIIILFVPSKVLVMELSL